MRTIIYIISAFLLSFAGIKSSFSQLQVTASNNAAQLAGTLAGNGVTISNATMNCPNGAAGTFNGTASNIGIAQGVLLTSGSVNVAPGPNNIGSAGQSNNSTFNDPHLMAIDPQAIYDVCILEFDAMPTCSTISFTFAFGSDEYPEFVSSVFNDAFGIFITGANPAGPAYNGYNMARIPISGVPVAINTVNNGTANAGPCANCAYYVNNGTGATPAANPTVQYDGFTTPITVNLNVVPCSTYRMKLAIADAGDHIFDSGVFFAMQSLVCATSLTVTATAQNAICNANNGSATVTNVAGGQAPYTYTWSTTPPQVGQTATGLAPGTYTVNVIDANGCLSGTQTVTVGNSGAAFTVQQNQTNVTCFGNNNGSATVSNPTGGTAPYTYSWSTNPPQTSSSISNVPAGNYTCTITDATGCVHTATFTITQPPALTGSITASTNVSCPPPSSPNGSATAIGSGGIGTISYSWNTNPAQTGATANNLAAGNYVVTITDANGCTVTASVTITAPASMSVTTSATPSACGVNDGTATASASGGAPPLTYLWLTNPVQTTPTAVNLPGGTYTIIITDGNGCTQSQSVIVPGGTPPVADFSFLPSDVISMLDPFVVFFDGSVGSPTVWTWNFGDPASGANNTSNLQNPSHTFSSAGEYCITLIISDAAGLCIDSITKCLKVEDPITFYIPNAFTPNFDGKNELFMAYGTNIKDFEIWIFDRWGNLIYHSTDITKGWNGKVKNKGDFVQEDVYVWKVNLVDKKDKKYRYVGHVTVVK